jgi:addiction module HigA family antidote
MNIMHTIASEAPTTKVPKRRYYSPELKLRVVQTSAHPGASLAGVALQNVLKTSSRVTPKMALRLSKSVGSSPESWLVLQDSYDLWLARQSVDLQRVGKLQLATT